MAPTDPAAVLLPGFVGTTLPEWLAERLRDGLAGVCLFGQNVVSIHQLRELTSTIRAANPLAIVAIDEEGGDVTRLFDRTGSPYPGNAILGRIDDPRYTEQVAENVGWQLRLAGVDLDFAPDVDVNSNPDNPVIGVRSFGADPDLVARHSAAWVRGLESTGTAGSAKHFPGHGDTAKDSHLALPQIDRSLDGLRARELVPFVAAIAAGTRAIMTSHIMVPQVDPILPATFSTMLLQRLLRGELGFDGVIVSDALDMVGASGEIGIPEAAIRAITGGCDLLCLGTENTGVQLSEIANGIHSAVRTGRLAESRLAEAASRNAALASSLRADDQHIRIPEYIAADQPAFDLERTMATFDYSPGLTVESGHRLITFDTVANVAVGKSPWGVGAAGADVLQVHEGDSVDFSAAGQPVLIGKANHLHPWVSDTIDRVRREHPSTIVVDMGWPGDDREYADIATFGASRHVGGALLVWLERHSRGALGADAIGVTPTNGAD